MPLEKRLYKIVEKFAASNEFGCNPVKQQVGTKMGTVDVIGVREIHGDLHTHNEIVAFEVKEENSRFLSAVGQARAYSIYAHKCYLVVKKRKNNAFTSEEIDIAAQLGVGLIEIRGDTCKVIATSAAFSPRDSYILTIFDKLELFRCVICHATYHYENMVNINKMNKIGNGDYSYTGELKKAIKNRKNAQYFLYQLNEQRSVDERIYTHDRRHICKDCLSIFASLTDWKTL